MPIPLDLPPVPELSRTDLLWWAALLIQSLAIPGTLLPVLPGLALLPLGALLWVWAVGWTAGWPVLAGMLVSRLAQFVLALVGVLGFVLLTTGVPRP